MGLRGRPKQEKDEKYYVRRELEAVSRYAQFRLRGINYQISMYEDEKKIHLVISVPVPRTEESHESYLEE